MVRGLFLLLFAATLCPAADDAFKPVEFLIGDWIGEGSGSPGQGGGSFSLSYDLDRKILVRRNVSEYPAANGRPAAHHEDLMIVYPESPLRAIYFDNEGHVIHYAVHAQANGVQFISEPSKKEPRFRLTYTKQDEGAVLIDFAIAPPGQPEGFKSYVAGTVHRKPDPQSMRQKAR